MSSERFVITYAAHTSACTFLLDADGICRRIVMNPTNKRRDSARTASQCVGAQYVASLDGAVAGCMVDLPRVGAALLFARVDERGRVSLVRTGPVQRFEAMKPEVAEEDPFDDVSVRTSAPEVPHVPAPRVRKIGKPAAPPPEDAPDPDYFDVSDQTARLAPSHVSPHDDLELRTEEYPSVPAPPPPPAPTRGMLPRRSDPHLKAAPRSSRPSSAQWSTDAKVATRRRER